MTWTIYYQENAEKARRAALKERFAPRRLPSGARVLARSELCDICGQGRRCFAVTGICISCSEE